MGVYQYLLVIIVSTLVGLLGRLIAPKIGRTKSEGFLLGCLLSIIFFFLIATNQMVYAGPR